MIVLLSANSMADQIGGKHVDVALGHKLISRHPGYDLSKHSVDGINLLPMCFADFIRVSTRYSRHLHLGQFVDGHRW